MDQLLREFLGEAEELVEVLAGDMQALRARRAEGRARRELVGRIFRHVHTLKGSSSAVELDTVTELAHEFETLLDGIRLGRVEVDNGVLDAFEDAVSNISEMLRAVSREEQPQGSPALIERLRRLAHRAEDSGPLSQRAMRALAALPEEIARSLTEYEEHRLHEALGEGAGLFIVEVNFDLATFDEQFRDLSDALGEGGEIVSTLPGMEGAAPDQINFRIVYATDKQEAELASRLAPFGAVKLAKLSEDKIDEEKAVVPLANEEAEESAPATITPLTTLVRVELAELDEMITATHELFTDTMGALDLTLLQNLLPRAEQTELEIRASRIRRRFVELEERLIGMRMVPVGQTLARAIRAGVTAARAIGKEIDFETEGGDVQLDKSLADAISDPLLHLLRNAVDHGIEMPFERTAMGKDARGVIRLKAVAEGSRVRLLITDDGRGIDPQRVARAAIERGVIERGAQVSGPEALRLIFAPGFSTAETVSNVSGRGVGLDVVEKAVEQAGGQILVQSEMGAGTTFELLLPTTLALLPALVIRSGGHPFCIDASHINEAGLIAADEVERLGEALVIRWRGAIVPLIQMRDLLAQSQAETNSDSLHIIVARVAGHEGEEAFQEDRRAAVVVDGWDGHHEVLVRGLGRHSARWRGVGGATELKDGQVALILDLPRLLEMAL
jgi:Chemotaxis protein histidine kinase and related kinases